MSQLINNGKLMSTSLAKREQELKMNILLAKS